MIRFLQLLQYLGLNSIMPAGVMFDGWSNGLAIMLFWCENAMMIPLISLRIMLHRRATNRRGHYVVASTRYDNGPWRTSTITYNRNFLQIFGFFTFVLGIFVLCLVAIVSQEVVDMNALRKGASAAALCMIAGLGIDVVGIGRRPFAWIENLQESVLRRNVLLFLTVMIGLPLAAWLGRPKVIFAIFGGLKLFFDVGSLFPQYDPEEAPRWMVRVFGRDFAGFWKQERRQDMQRKNLYDKSSEEPYDGRPMGNE